MNILHVRISNLESIKKRLIQNAKGQEDCQPCLNFLNYSDMHKVLAPSRLAIVQVLSGKAPLSIREVARQVGRDVQAVHRDVTTLINAGVIDKTEKGVSFPYDGLHFDFDIKVAA